MPPVALVDKFTQYLIENMISPISMVFDKETVHFGLKWRDAYILKLVPLLMGMYFLAYLHFLRILRSFYILMAISPKFQNKIIKLAIMKSFSFYVLLAFTCIFKSNFDEFS